MYLSFTAPLRQLGHDVDTFDHFEASRVHGKEAATERLIETIRGGSYDVVLYQTSGREPVDTTALTDLSKKVCIAAWNSDDDWQWGETSQLACHFTYMVTTYPHIYEKNRVEYPNLLLSQWACQGMFSDFGRKKDLDFSFVGSAYGKRNGDCRYLRHRAGLKCYGRGARLVRLGLPYVRGVFKASWLAGRPVSYETVNEIWNRSRVSYTPMSGGPNGAVLSLKGRAFEMGLSGTLLLCEHSPNLERYYEPGRECVTFETLEDCAEKARWYLAHEEERAKIARNYGNRTLAEHLWTDRFTHLFRQMRLADRSPVAELRHNVGLSGPQQPKVGHDVAVR